MTDLEGLIVPHYKVVIVQEHDEGEQVRKHRKRRINKKWLKKYGTYGKQKLNKDQILMFNNILFMSRPLFRKIKKDVRGEIDLQTELWNKHLEMYEKEEKHE